MAKNFENNSKLSGLENEAPSLSSLQIIDRLEVGPARVEKRRIITPYTVFRNGKKETTNLMYVYQENVFESSDQNSQNLADMITAQVALNYSLFCKQIIFHGIFDKYDQSFLTQMAQNTAREIYVIKLLHKNLFLLPPFDTLQPEIKKSYLQAELIFSDSPKIGKNSLPGNWNAQGSKYAVLSSGGKDSLLSYGLLNEMGKEVHPVFINESGRHWFTALNAYRYFDSQVENTSRVWTNADRLYNWMLKWMPFIRQDFAKVRSDGYPIRLWTVAVFLFGALPIIRLRGIGRLIIGDEYDTTRRLKYKGITHYDGLFDQSRYFDEALSRYFNQKRWHVHQFSLIRNLSELLIEKLLVERYPGLQIHQISCHAAHQGKDRILPCGRCEKCRRIVGMLSALGSDPGRCGYTPEQISDCLEGLKTKSVHQESAGSSHMKYLLVKRGIYSKHHKTVNRFKPHPEILKLRVDKERAPLETIPADLREQLFNLLLENAEGVVKKTGAGWEEIDLIPEIMPMSSQV